MNEEKQTKKKKRSFWWIWLILILLAFGGGIIAGLKINTLPLPNQVKDRLYPILESYIPGSTTPGTAAPETPAETEAPAETAAPAATEAPAETAAPAETEAPAATEVPAVTEAPAETEAPAAAELPEETPAPEAEAVTAETEAPAKTFESEETPAVLAAADQTAAARYIGVDRAMEIALQSAEAEDKKAEVNGVFRTKDEDGNTVYQVSFQADGTRYDYVIDAFSGEVMSWKLSGLSFSETAVYGEEEKKEA